MLTLVREYYYRYKHVFHFSLIDILTRGITIFTLPLYLHFMTIEEFGIYNYLFTIVALSPPLLTFYFFTSITALNSKTKSNETFSSLFIPTVIKVSIIFFIILFFRVDIFLLRNAKSVINSYIPIRVYFLGSIYIQAILLLIYCQFQSQKQFQNLKIYNSSKNLIKHALVLSAFLFLLNAQNSIFLRFKYMFIGDLILLVYFGIKVLKYISLKLNLEVYKSGLVISIPLFFSGILNLGYLFSDSFILEKYNGPEALSIYGASLTIAGIFPLLTSSIQNYFAPHLFELSSHKEAHQYSVNAIKKTLIIFLILFVLIWVATYIIIEIGLIKEEYYLVLIIFPLVGIGRVFEGLSQFLKTLLTRVKKTRIIFFNSLLISTISIVSGLILIPKFGLIGAGFIIPIASITSFIFFHFYSNKLAL